MYEKSARFYDLIYRFKDYAREAEILRGLFPEGAQSLLDVACGTGKHLELLKDDLPQCEGLDLDAGLLKVAAERLPDVPFHHADMTAFDLGKYFDVVTCLFSAIGYAGTVEKLNAAIVCMAEHLKPGGLLIVEPWLKPEVFRLGHVTMLTAEEADLKVCRMTFARQEGIVSILEFHYLVAERGKGVSTFSEAHHAAMFSHEDYLNAFRRAGLAVDYDEQGLMGRGLYTGVKST